MFYIELVFFRISTTTTNTHTHKHIQSNGVKRKRQKSESMDKQIIKSNDCRMELKEATIQLQFQVKYHEMLTENESQSPAQKL